MDMLGPLEGQRGRDLMMKATIAGRLSLWPVDVFDPEAVGFVPLGRRVEELGVGTALLVSVVLVDGAAVVDSSLGGTLSLDRGGVSWT